MTEELKQKAFNFLGKHTYYDECKGTHYRDLTEMELLALFAEEATKELEAQIEKMINEIDKIMVLSNMQECEICDIQDIFRKYGFKRNSNDTWEIKEK